MTHGPALRLGVRYQLLVLHRVDDPRHHPLPVLHQLVVGDVVLSQFLQVIGKGVGVLELGLVDRVTGVQRMSLHIDDAGLRAAPGESGLHREN